LSRLPSSRGSSASTTTRAAAAAPRRPGVLVQSPKSDIFVVLLGISLGAIVLGCLLMFLLLSRYGFSVKVTATPVPSQMSRLV
jgi:hypothetical protein